MALHGNFVTRDTFPKSYANNHNQISCLTKVTVLIVALKKVSKKGFKYTFALLLEFLVNNACQ